MKSAYGLGAVGSIAAIFAANILLADDGNAQRLAAYIITALSLMFLLSLIGREIKQRPGGIVIDNRNRVSLSKLQAVAWTILIMSGLITAAAIRMHAGNPDPLGIKIGTDLLIVMGISAASMVASPAILRLKAETPASDSDLFRAAEVGDVAAVGQVHGRPTSDQAQWADIFRGDEVGNASSPDLGKIQQFLITGLLLSYYAILLGNMCWYGLDKTHPLSSLPGFDESMVWLLGISHAGYLGYKAAPHSSPGLAVGPIEEVG